MAKKMSISDSVDKALKKEEGKFSGLSSFKKNKGLSQIAKYKEQEWLPLSPAFNKVIQLPGIPLGQITLLRGHSDSGKTTSLIEIAVSAQKAGILPVFIITEMKWNWQRAIKMGFQLEDVVDEETGEIIDVDGFFIYADRSVLKTTEGVAAFIIDLLNEQKKGRLPYNLMFLWDSIGSLPCDMVIEKGKVMNEWNAGAMSQQFGNFVNQEIILSRKETSKYTNTLVAINKVWVKKPELPKQQPKIKNKYGDTMYFDSALVVTFGGVADSGTNKINAVSKNRTVEYAKRTKISVDKLHTENISCKGTVIMTPHGFIDDTKEAINEYKKEHFKELVEKLGTDSFSIEIDEDEDVSTIEYDE